MAPVKSTTIISNWAPANFTSDTNGVWWTDWVAITLALSKIRSWLYSRD